MTRKEEKKMLTASANSGATFTPIPEGTYAAVCNMLIDLGMQYNETYKKTSRKVLIQWQIPDEIIEIDGKEEPRIISRQYTLSLGENSTLRADLASWRGKDFTPQELQAFDLRNIVGAGCLIGIIHKESNGKKYANISSVIALPKGMAKPQMIGQPTIFDLDTDPLDIVDNLPKWIYETIAKSETYKERVAKEDAEDYKAAFTECDDDGDLPF